MRSLSCPFRRQADLFDLLRADTSDVKLCVLSLPEVFPTSACSSASLDAHVDPLTLSLIDSNTLILLNKSDAIDVSTAHIDALRQTLEKAGKTWLGAGGKAFWKLSVKSEVGLKEFSEGLREVLKDRCALDSSACLKFRARTNSADPRLQIRPLRRRRGYAAGHARASSEASRGAPLNPAPLRRAAAHSLTALQECQTYLTAFLGGPIRPAISTLAR